MAAMERANEIVRNGHSHDSEAQWPELVSRAVNDLSRIVHAEIRFAELGIKGLIEQEIDRSLKVVIALGFLLCAAVCAVGAAWHRPPCIVGPLVGCVCHRRGPFRVSRVWDSFSGQGVALIRPHAASRIIPDLIGIEEAKP